MSKLPIIQWIEDILNPLPGKMRRDMEAMRAENTEWQEKLESIPSDEWDLLSRQFIPQPGQKKRKNAPLKGLFCTIYQEPLIAWSYKAYKEAGGKAFILTACTRSQTYLYKNTGGGSTEIAIGPYRVGDLLPDGRLISSRKKELLAVAGKGNGTYTPITVYGREVGGVVIPQETQAPMPRAFAFLSELDDKERDLFLSMAILLLVRQQIS
jgi:hypothetical protein